MAYRVVSGRIGPNAKVPDDDTEEEGRSQSPVQSELPRVTQTILPDKNDTELGRLLNESRLENTRSLSDIYDPVEAARKRLEAADREKLIKENHARLDAQRQQALAKRQAEAAFRVDAPAGTFLPGQKVVRKVKPHNIGVIYNITYHFDSSKKIKSVWVKFPGKEALPYEAVELQHVSIH